MKLIIGLGNPGEKYKKTRHNVGFIMVDKFKERHAFPDFEFNKKFNAEISISNNPLLPLEEGGSMPQSGRETVEGQTNNNNKIILIKPQTFMNNSGEAVKSILDFYKLSPESIIIIHDDVDIPLRKYKIATDSSSAGHHGVQDLIEKLGTQKITRVRIGIGQVKEGALVCRLDASDYVVQKFSPEELEIIEKISGEILKEIENWTKKTT